MRDEDFRARPDPKRQFEMAVKGQLQAAAKPLGMPAAMAAERPKGKTLVQVFAEEEAQQDRARGAIHCFPVGVFAEVVGKKTADKKDMNGTEEAWSRQLEAERMAGRIQWWAFQPFTLRIADGCRYTPDFATWDGRALKFWEVKGFWRDDARVKIKVAAAQFPFLEFAAVSKRKKKDGGGWKVEWF